MTATPPQTIQLAIQGMHCAGCVATVEQALRKLDGVRDASVNLILGQAVVACEASIDPAALQRTVAAAGYTASVLAADAPDAVETAMPALPHAPHDSQPHAPPAPRNTARNHSAAGARGAPHAVAEQSLLRAANERAAELRAGRRRIALALLFGLPISAHHMIPGMHSWIGHGAIVIVAQIALTLLVMIGAGGAIFASALRALRHGAANMDTLIALGAGAAFFSGVAGVILGRAELIAFEAAVTILLFISVGKYFETLSRGRAAAALERLFELIPRTAVRVRGDQVESIAVAALVPGDVVRVAAPAAIPVDGEVVAGLASIDESLLTGEALPRTRGPGARVQSGTRVIEGALDVRAGAVERESAVARIARLVAAAQATKPPLQRLADRVAGIFVPLVIGLALLTGAAWLAAGESTAWALQRALVVLVVACPCAMGLAIPTAVLVGTSRAAQFGILLRNSAALEALGHAREILLDKTGTLTLGRPRVDEIHPAPGVAPDEVLAHAAPLARLSEHPLARGIVAAAEERAAQGQTIPLPSAQAHAPSATNTPALPRGFRMQPGAGLAAELDGAWVVLGSRSWLAANGIELPADTVLTPSVRDRLQSSLHTRPASPDGPPTPLADPRSDDASQRSHHAASGRSGDDDASAVFVARGRQFLGQITFLDRAHDDAAATIAALRRLGLRVVLVSGDQPATVARLAAELGVDEYHAAQTPADKLALVERRRAGGGTLACGVLMVGDGVNDAAALAAATVGIAIGTGADVAREAADVCLVGHAPRLIARAIEISRATYAVMRQNLFWAFGYNVVMLPLAALAPLPAGWAAAAMMFSSLSVVLNALRLRKA